MGNEGSQRIAELDGVRGAAILSVIVAHAFALPLLWAGVDIFFVLSGFLITGILFRRKEVGGVYFSYFYSRRARRILIPYLLLLVVSSLLFGTAWTRYWYWFAFFATNIAASLKQVRHESLLPLWSLAVEEQFYLVWPFVIMLVSKRAVLRISIFLVVAAPILRAVATPLFGTSMPIYYLTPFRMDLLASGAIVAYIKRWRPQLVTRLRNWPQLTFAGACVLVVILGLIDPNFRTSANTLRGNVFIYSFTNLLATSLVIIALNRQSAICIVLRNPILRYVGRISYSMYLIHQTALVLAARVFEPMDLLRIGFGVDPWLCFCELVWI